MKLGLCKITLTLSFEISMLLLMKCFNIITSHFLLDLIDLILVKGRVSTHFIDRLLHNLCCGFMWINTSWLIIECDGILYWGFFGNLSFVGQEGRLVEWLLRFITFVAQFKVSDAQTCRLWDYMRQTFIWIGVWLLRLSLVVWFDARVAQFYSMLMTFYFWQYLEVLN